MHTYHHTNIIMYINIKSQVTILVLRRIQQRRCDLTQFGKQILPRYGRQETMISNSARASLGMASQTVCNSDSGAAMGRSLVMDARSHRINANGKDSSSKYGHVTRCLVSRMHHKRAMSALLHISRYFLPGHCLNSHHFVYQK